MCGHMCYYREYDPYRRLQALKRHAEARIGSQFNGIRGWKAKLCAPDPMPKCSDSETKDKIPWHAMWGVQLTSPGGNEYKSVNAALEGLLRRAEFLSECGAKEQGELVITNKALSLRTPERHVRNRSTRQKPQLYVNKSPYFSRSPAIRRLCAGKKRKMESVPRTRRMKTRKRTADCVAATATSTGSTTAASGSRGDWEPPESPFGFLEEILYQDPWRLLLSCILLNKTTRRQVDPVFYQLTTLFPTPAAMARGDPERLAVILAPLGLHRQRAASLIRFSSEYEAGGWANVSALHAIGPYARDAYEIFCEGRWASVKPSDAALKAYCAWMRARGRSDKKDG